ncbi:MAG TPA: hypothetical protein VE911_05210 [Candidatus Nitrosopolaris sp.]|nr:hypothetical protein [Candidatus Nitrosopolaris sp.]
MRRDALRSASRAGKTGLLLAALAVTVVRVAYPPRGASGVHSAAIRPADLGRLVFGQTNGGDVERLFGTPDERAVDGALTYRAALVSRRAGGEGETVTFRFKNGVLSRICRSRS